MLLTFATPTTPEYSQVRVTLSTGVDKRNATFTQFVATQPDPNLFGSHMAMGRGVMQRGTSSSEWVSALKSSRNFAENPALAQHVSSAVHDAYRAFLTLGIAPNFGPEAYEAPDTLTIEGNDGMWSFPRATAPAAAQAVFDAAAQIVTAPKPATAPVTTPAPNNGNPNECHTGGRWGA